MSRTALAQDAFRGHPVDLGADGLEARGRRLFVARRNGFENLADRVPHFRAHRHVVRAALDRLPSTLLSRLDVRHVQVPPMAGPRTRSVSIIGSAPRRSMSVA